jgi:hypothetical protein
LVVGSRVLPTTRTDQPTVGERQQGGGPQRGPRIAGGTEEGEGGTVVPATRRPLDLVPELKPPWPHPQPELDPPWPEHLQHRRAPNRTPLVQIRRERQGRRREPPARRASELDGSAVGPRLRPSPASPVVGGQDVAPRLPCSVAASGAGRAAEGGGRRGDEDVTDGAGSGEDEVAVPPSVSQRARCRCGIWSRH